METVPLRSAGISAAAASVDASSVVASVEAASVLAASVDAASVLAASVEAASLLTASEAVLSAGAELSVVVLAEPHPANAAITRVAAAAIATNFFFIIFLLYTNRFLVCDSYNNCFLSKKKAGYGLGFVRFM